MENKPFYSEKNNDNFIIGKKAFDEGKYEIALKYLLTDAEENNADAQALVGLIYFFDLTNNRNLENAVYWLEKASQNGRGDAAHNLSTLYLSCEPEMPINQEKARYWLRRAKELGFEVAPEEWYKSILD